MLVKNLNSYKPFFSSYDGIILFQMMAFQGRQ